MSSTERRGYSAGENDEESEMYTVGHECVKLDRAIEPPIKDTGPQESIVKLLLTRSSGRLPLTTRRLYLQQTSCQRPLRRSIDWIHIGYEDVCRPRRHTQCNLRILLASDGILITAHPGEGPLLRLESPCTIFAKPQVLRAPEVTGTESAPTQ